MMQRFLNARNPCQGSHIRVLCVCSAGLRRSQTLAWMLSNSPYNCNTRAAGSVFEYALIPVDEALIEWADHLLFANSENMQDIKRAFGDALTDREMQMWCLELPDRFSYRDPELVELIPAALEKCGLAKVLGVVDTVEEVSTAPVKQRKRKAVK